jgi:hypothetical protein
MNKKMFNLHLKECEFRFNNRKQNIYRVLLGIFRKGPYFFGSISFLTPLIINVFGEKILAFKFVLAVETQEK